MSQTITQAKESLSGMLHGGTLNKVRNIEALFERSQNTMLAKIDPVETERTQPLASVVYDDVYNYALPSDYKKIIDLIPQDDRTSWDKATRVNLDSFDLRKLIANKTISIEGSEGSKIIRINWDNRTPKTLNTLNSLTSNGTWSAVATASNLAVDTIFKKSGSGSVKFDVAASGDGIQNTSMSQVDLTLEDEVANVFVWFYIKNSADLANLNNVNIVWGNDLSSNYWTPTAATTQADGTAFKVGFNLVKFDWATATETGTVDPSAIDSAKVIFDVDAAITQIRVDNIMFAIGRNFDIKYNSKYIFKNSAGTLISRPTSDDDTIVLDNDANQIFLLELLKAAAQQIEGTDSGFDIAFSNNELHGLPSSRWELNAKTGLYQLYQAEYPAQTKKAIGSYGSKPGRGRWGYGRGNFRR